MSSSLGGSVSSVLVETVLPLQSCGWIDASMSLPSCSRSWRSQTTLSSSRPDSRRSSQLCSSTLGALTTPSCPTCTNTSTHSYTSHSSAQSGSQSSWLSTAT